MNTDVKISEVVRSMVSQVRETAPAGSTLSRPGDGNQASRGAQAARKGPAVPSKEDVGRVATEVQAHLKRLNTDLKIEVDERENTVVVKILDSETNDIIRQVPAEEIMAIRERMKALIGMLYDVET